MLFSITYAVKVGKTYDVLVDMPLSEFLDVIKDLGYHGIEPNIANPFEFDIGRFREEVESRELRVSAISTGLSYVTYGYSLSSCDEKVRSKAVEFFTKYIDIAEELGCKNVVIGLARGRGESCEDKKFLAQSIREIVKRTPGSDVALLIEPLNRYETRIINRIDEALSFVKELRDELGDRVGLLFDTFHATLEERDPYIAYLRVREWVKHIHVADSNRRAPGEGMIDWLKFLAIVKSCGYSGFISIEALPSPTIMDTIRKSAETLFRIAKMLS